MFQAPGGSAAMDSQTPAPSTDYGDGSLFKEIGHTLEDVAMQSITGAVVGLRTAVARQALASQEGQLVAGTQTAARLAPVIMVVMVLLALFVGYRLISR
jgi:hypothetical protein